jgi:hypothetical protein
MAKHTHPFAFVSRYLHFAVDEMRSVFHHAQTDSIALRGRFPAWESASIIPYLQHAFRRGFAPQAEMDFSGPAVSDGVVHRLLGDAEKMNLRLLADLGRWIVNVADTFAAEIFPHRLGDQHQPAC